jgi:hypothetical protein
MSRVLRYSSFQELCDAFVNACNKYHIDQSMVQEQVVQGRIQALRKEGATWENIAAMLGYGIRAIYKISRRGPTSFHGFDHASTLVAMMHKDQIVCIDQLPDLFRKKGMSVRLEKCKVILKECTQRGLFTSIKGRDGSYIYNGNPIDNLESDSQARKDRSKRALYVVGAAHSENTFVWRTTLEKEGLDYLRAIFSSDGHEYPIRERLQFRDDETGTRRQCKGNAANGFEQLTAHPQEPFATYGALLVLSPDIGSCPGIHKLAHVSDAIAEYMDGSDDIFIRPTFGNLDKRAIRFFTAQDLPHITTLISEQVRQAGAIAHHNQQSSKWVITLIVSDLTVR